MSGHANFHTITGTRLQVSVNAQIGGNQDITRSMSFGGVNSSNMTYGVEQSEEIVQSQLKGGALSNSDRKMLNAAADKGTYGN